MIFPKKNIFLFAYYYYIYYMLIKKDNFDLIFKNFIIFI